MIWRYHDTILPSTFIPNRFDENFRIDDENYTNLLIKIVR